MEPFLNCDTSAFFEIFTTSKVAPVIQFADQYVGIKGHKKILIYLSGFQRRERDSNPSEGVLRTGPFGSTVFPEGMPLAQDRLIKPSLYYF